MSDYTDVVRHIQLQRARTMTQAEAIQYNTRSGTTNPDKYFKISRTRSIQNIFGYFNLPLYHEASDAQLGDLIFQYEVTLPTNFFIRSLYVEGDRYITETVSHASLCVKYRVGTTVYRYFLAGTQRSFDDPPTKKLYVPYYNSEVIGKNCVFELLRFGTLTRPFDVGLFGNIKVNTSLYRLPAFNDELEYNVATVSRRSFDQMKISTGSVLDGSVALNALYLSNTI